MSITLKQLKQKTKLFLNNYVWPFTAISDLKSKLDQAEYDRRIAVDDLVNYMRRDIRAADIQINGSFGGRPAEVKVFTGYEPPQITLHSGYSDSNIQAVTKVVVLDPLVINFVDYRPYPNFDTRDEPAEHYKRMLADHVSGFIYDRIMNGDHNGQ